MKIKLSLKTDKPSKEYQNFVETVVEVLEEKCDTPHTAKLILLDAISLISFRAGHVAAHNMEKEKNEMS